MATAQTASVPLHALPVQPHTTPASAEAPAAGRAPAASAPSGRATAEASAAGGAAVDGRSDGTPGADPPSATLIGSVQRAMRLLECVAGHPHGAPAKQLARETGLALPTAYHLLRTLVHEGYLHRDKGLFFLGRRPSA